MSLDVYLSYPSKQNAEPMEHIFVRQDGAVVELSRAEWDEKFPGREPVVITEYEGATVYQANITHNLNRMATEAGIYEALWRPEEIGITHAYQLIKPLTVGLEVLLSDAPRYKEFDALNGWGRYENLVGFVTEYLAACKDNPNAEVTVSR